MSKSVSSVPYFIVNIEAAICKNGKWLMCIRSENESHAGGLLSLIGGKLEYYDSSRDSIEETIKREVLEETGLTIAPIDYVQSSSFVSKKGNHVLDIVYLCDVISGVPSLVSPDELQELSWMTLEEIYAHPMAPEWLISSMKQADNLNKSLHFK